MAERRPQMNDDDYAELQELRALRARMLANNADEEKFHDVDDMENMRDQRL